MTGLTGILFPKEFKDFSEEITERFLILAESEGFRIFSEISSEGLLFSFGNGEGRLSEQEITQ